MRPGAGLLSAPGDTTAVQPQFCPILLCTNSMISVFYSVI